MVNLAKQIENARFFGVHAVVAVNRFPYVFSLPVFGASWVVLLCKLGRWRTKTDRPHPCGIGLSVFEQGALETDISS